MSFFSCFTVRVKEDTKEIRKGQQNKPEKCEWRKTRNSANDELFKQVQAEF